MQNITLPRNAKYYSMQNITRPRNSIANTTAVHTAQTRLHQTLHGSLLIDIGNFKSSMKIEECFFFGPFNRTHFVKNISNLYSVRNQV